MKKKILKRKINFIVEPIKNYLFKGNHQRVNIFAKYYDKLKIEKNTILYESRDGNSVTDSPYAMFKYMLENPKYKGYTHIWSIADFDVLDSVISEYNDYSNVKFVKRNSRKYIKYLATSEYLINNSTFQSFFIPKKEQVYINTWHGTPLKSMGFDIPGNPSHSQNVVRNFLSTAFILSPNAHTTKIFTDSYKLDGLYKGTIIEEGYPRIDLTFNTNPGKYKDYLRKLGLGIVDDKKTILYAPTWKGTNTTKVNNDVLQIIADINYLENEVGNDYNILIKVHPYLYKAASIYPEIKHRLVPDFVDTNELLSSIDLLITDYSSIFFDFLVTNKPILFYTWDTDAYSEERGQYINNDELPGLIVFNSKELADAIKNIEIHKENFVDKYKKMQEKFTNHDDGKVTERVVNYLFNNDAKNLNLINKLDAQKEKMLIYPGGLRNNGITSSFINLMNNIDFDKYDVSCFTATPHSKEVLNNLAKVHQNVRFLFKPGLPIYKLFEVYRDKFIHNRGKRGFFGKILFPEKAYVREHARLFGNTKFDYVIDFSGYSLYWAKYLIVADAKKKICYMHNDLLSESEKRIDGKRPHRINLRGLFSVYNRFDKLVSVSKGTMELNRENLIEYAPFEKFDYIMNSINPEKILQVDSSQEVEEAEQKNGLSMETENFKARAILKEINKYPVWNILPINPNAKQLSISQDLKNAEIIISRKAFDEQNTYYKFSHNNRIVGWIKSEAVKVLADEILHQQNLNKLARVVRPRGNHIWSKPYKVAGFKKVSPSTDYKDIIVDIDQEAETLHGEYSRISINDTVIGWIDNSALKIYEQCTIDETTSELNKKKISYIRNSLKSKNHKIHKEFIDNIENRTLQEINVQKMYAIISKPDNHTIWSKAYPNIGALKIDNAKTFEGKMARITTINKTRKGTYYLFTIDNEEIGWLDSKAFDTENEPTLLKERPVSLVAELEMRKKDSVWTKPYGLEGAQKILRNANLNGNIVTINKEVTTNKSTYSHILNNGLPIGWVDNKALKVKEKLGFEIDNKFIPSPAKEDFNFVNMGRLSPEKGQDNLIKAFAGFHKKQGNSKLYILGAGPLKEDLQALIDSLDLNDSVYLLGQIENPFSFLKKCDCFVLSSHYEGQPMVLLEAMTLEMKIIATDIVANRTVLEDGEYGMLVEDSISGLEKGLISMASGTNHKFKQFNYNIYNSSAMESFYDCLQS